MKYKLTIAILCMSFLTKAQITSQKVDSAMHKIESAKNKSAASIDSTHLKFNTHIDKALQSPQTVRKKLDSSIDKLGGADQADETVLKDSSRLKNRSRAKYEPAAIQHRLDSINRVLKQNETKTSRLDSVNGKIDNVLTRITLPTGTNKTDSLNNKVDSVQNKALTLIDPANLKINERSKDVTDSITQKITATLQVTKLTSKIDSLKAAGLNTDKYSRKLDSLNALTDVSKHLQKPVAKLDEAQAKIQKLQDVPTKNINEKIDLLSKEAGGKGNLENLNLPTKDLNLTQGIPGTDGKLLNTDATKSIPGLNTPSTELPNNPLNKDLDITKQLDRTADLGKFDKLQESTGKVSEMTSKAGDKVSGYTGDIKNIKDGNLDNIKSIKDEDVISKLPVGDELKTLAVKDEFIKEQEAVIAPYKNPEAYKKKTLERAKKMVALQLVTQEKQLQEMVSKVSSYQNKMGTILGKTSNLPKRRDSLKKLRMIEKFVPGLTLQIQKPGAWLVDINPSLRYRLTSYWSAGLGWNERVLFGNYRLSYDQVRVFGPRTFSEVVIFKGLSFRLDAEAMNSYIIPRQQLQIGSDAGKRAWVWSYMVGLKKEFSFLPKVIGNVQFMYNLYSSNSDNAYPTRLNIRFGFEHNIKRKHKKKQK